VCACLLAALAGSALDQPRSRAQDAPRPSRIVSLDLCTDQLLIELVARERIAAVTHLAADRAVSAISEKARGLPITRGEAEDVLRYDPDLILAGPFGVSPTVNLLRRLGRNVVVVPLPSELERIRTSVELVGSAVGARAEADAMLATFDRRIRDLRRTPAGNAPTAVVYQVSGAVSTPGTLADDVLRVAGFRNMAGDYRLSRGDQVSLEALVANPPDLLVLSSAADEYRTVAADNLRHPALRRLRESRPSVEVPWQLWLCGTPHIIEAVERLAAARAKLEAQRQ
jgi:iron complex transport system substrate-binding protein